MNKPNDESCVDEEINIDDVPTTKPRRKANPLEYLPPELQQRASKLPPGQQHTVLDLKNEGDGHNASLLSVAATCFNMGVSFDDTLDHLQAAYSPDRMDYESAPKRAVTRVWQAEGDLTKLTDQDAESAPDMKEEMLLRFRRTQQIDMVEASPGKLATPTYQILKRMFKNDDIINIQHTALEVGTLVTMRDIPEFLEKTESRLEDYKFLNPATFKKIEGVPNPLHPKNKVSTRCNENVKSRSWVVLEMDSKDEPSQERFNTFAMAMAKFAPLVLAIDSGNKSVHFWFDASNVKPIIRRGFFNLACLHGSDPRLAVKSQIARMPNTPSAGDGRGAQRVLYYDPDGVNTPDEWDLKGFESFINHNKQLEYYYNGSNKSYLTRDNMESWVTLDRTSLRSHLAEKGYRPITLEGENIAPLDLVINSIQLDKNVEAVLSGASGRHAGLYEENGHRVIVKKSPTFIKPRKGKFPTIHAFLVGLLGHEPGQLEVFFGWVSDSLKKLRNDGKRRAVWGPCQMLHIMGPPNAGKTLLLKDILTPCFANRVASADPLFKKFPDLHNADTFGCELLFLDDSDVLETNYVFRQSFGERIKSFTVGVGGGLRDMQQSRVNMRPWWRFIRLMNMEPATLSTLPPLDEGVEDKLIFLRGEDMSLGPLGKEMLLPGWYERIERRIKDELPAFLHFLLEEFNLPDEYKDPKQRFPTCSFKSDELMSEITQGSPEQYIMHRIDHDGRAIFTPLTMDIEFDDNDNVPMIPWQGTADALYDALAIVGQRSSQQRFVKACPSPRVLLSQLRNLEKSHPSRFGYSRRLSDYPDRRKGAEYWVVFPPDDEQPPVQTLDPELEELF